MKIYIIEDDVLIAKNISTYLEKWAYQTQITEDFKHILPEFIEFDPQLVLLDVNLPYYDGFYWCAEIRKISNAPIIFISSETEDTNVIRSIENGADDYITKPFKLEVLMAKIKSLLRRTYDFGTQSSIIEHKGLIFNNHKFTMTYEDKVSDLTKNEALILNSLLERKGQVLKRHYLMDILWDSESYVDDSALYANITRLRKKIKDLGLEELIVTKKGEGYYIEE
ncbi:response regulator transcription factor [Facklamia sp. DSM 111018]|uniref:Response regulator transcription factor n=1 Tax=Facklamia lactis TaxID=2749967 RepID=A0ABS0LQB0_9LACT|nr:response regulator transcription factor [Facklamia lactis]MBG9980547.1 response regulator transcription factor [Facklamia lactis]MBG9986339.1 response regulator transcription factor [Facklamia lactis]